MNKSYNICIQMFTQRGYQIADQEDDEHEQISAVKQNGDKIYAFFLSTQFNVKRVEEYVSLMNQLNISHSVIVNTGGVTPPAKKIVESFYDITFELFSQDELQTNITQHRLQPRFERLQQNEADEFKKTYSTVVSNTNELGQVVKNVISPKISIMLATEPVSRFYAYKKGDIIRIHRKTGYITYRIVR
jgi:DNA-directed RNA polymerase subunit H (RpoH/RPB5)